MKEKWYKWVQIKTLEYPDGARVFNLMDELAEHSILGRIGFKGKGIINIVVPMHYEEAAIKILKEKGWYDGR